MPTIKNGKVGFHATWKGRSDDSNNITSFRLYLPESEQAASIYIYSLCQQSLNVKVFIGKEKIEIGDCFYKHLSGGETGDGTLTFKIPLEEWTLTPLQQARFKDNDLIILVTLNGNENDNDE